MPLSLNEAASLSLTELAEPAGRDIPQRKHPDKRRFEDIVCNLGNMQTQSVVLSNVSPAGPVASNISS